MKFKRLHIDAFGKFRDFTLTLSDGIHVLYGENEAGKSTIHAFIEGMLFDFVNPTLKVKRRYKTFERYKPTDTDAFGGTLVVEHDNKSYRLERTFNDTKKRNLKVYDEATGKDITETLPVDSLTKEADLQTFFDVPYLLYKNTMSIDQVAPHPSSDASQTLSSRLQSLKTSMGDSLNSAKARASIEAKLRAIGTKSARTKPYAKTIRQIEETKDALEDAKAREEKVRSLQKELDTDRETYQEKNATLKQYEAWRDALNNEENKQTYKQGKTLFDAINQSLMHRGTHFESPDDVLNLAFKHKSMIETLKDAHFEARQLTSAITQLNESLPREEEQLDRETYGNIKADYDRLKRIEQQIDPSTRDALMREKDHLGELKKEGDVEIASRVRARRFTLTSLTLTALGLSIPLSIVMYPPGLISLLSLLVPVLAGVFFTHKLSDARTKRDHAAETLHAKEKAIERQEKTHKQAKEDIDKLLKKHGFDDVESFTKHVYNAEIYYANYRKALKQREQIEQSIDKRRQILNKYTPLFEAFNLEPTKETLDLLVTLQPPLHTLMRLFESTTVKALESSIDFNVTPPEDVDKKTLESSIKALHSSINDLEKRIASKEATIHEQWASARPISVLEHTLQTLETRRAQYEAQIDVYTQALKRIEAAEETIESRFAPALSEAISSNLASLTKGSYETIKVRKDFSFSVDNPYTKRYDQAPHFSKGTLDQIYFAVRLGILHTLGKTDAPLMIDDAFVNFDDVRLKQALDMLKRVSPHRQIILFTCQSREHTLLKEQSIPHHLITIEKD